MVDIGQVSGDVSGRVAGAETGVLVALQTNNPRKINMLEALGVAVTERIPCLVQSQEFNQGYLAVKAARMSHVRPMLADRQHLGSFTTIPCPVADSTLTIPRTLWFQFLSQNSVMIRCGS